MVKKMCFYVRFLNRTLNSSAAIYCVNKKFYKFSCDVTTGNRAHISPTNDDGGGVAEPHLATFILHVTHAPAQCKGYPLNPTISPPQCYKRTLLFAEKTRSGQEVQ